MLSSSLFIIKTKNKNIIKLTSDSLNPVQCQSHYKTDSVYVDWPNNLNQRCHQSDWMTNLNVSDAVNLQGSQFSLFGCSVNLKPEIIMCPIND